MRNATRMIEAVMSVYCKNCTVPPMGEQFHRRVRQMRYGLRANRWHARHHNRKRP